MRVRVQSYWLRIINMDPKGPRPTSEKLRLNLHGTCFGVKINWFRPPKKQKNKELKRELMNYLKNKDAS
jgi:hypothetical protein